MSTRRIRRGSRARKWPWRRPRRPRPSTPCLRTATACAPTSPPRDAQAPRGGGGGVPRKRTRPRTTARHSCCRLSRVGAEPSRSNHRRGRRCWGTVGVGRRRRRGDPLSGPSSGAAPAYSAAKRIPIAARVSRGGGYTQLKTGRAAKRAVLAAAADVRLLPGDGVVRGDDQRHPAAAPRMTGRDAPAADSIIGALRAGGGRSQLPRRRRVQPLPRCQAGWRFFFLIPWNRYRSKSALFALPYERLNSQCLAGSLTLTHFRGVSYANDSLFLGGNG